MVGVGGSSMSGLAGLLKDEGYDVTGSDRTRSHKTDALEARGVRVLIGHRAENVRGAQLVVYSAAIAPDNPERAEATPDDESSKATASAASAPRISKARRYGSGSGFMRDTISRPTIAST